MLAHNFMKDNSYTHMIFIDADVVWNPENVLMLLSHDEECCYRVYPNSHYHWHGNKLKLGAK